MIESNKESIERYVIPRYQPPRTKLVGSPGDVLGRKRLYNIIKKLSFKSVLDIGFGVGKEYVPFTSMGMKYVGIEPVKENVKNAKKRYPKGDFRVGFAHRLEFPDNSFDLVWAWSVIEILPKLEDRVQAVEECIRVAKRSFFMIDTLTPPVDFEKRYLAVSFKHALSISRISRDKDFLFVLWRVDKA